MSLIKKLNTCSVKADNACLNLLNQSKLKNLRKQFESITNQENNIHSLAKDGIINLVETTNMIAMTNKKKLDIKEKLVATVHVTTDGIPRAISTEPNNQGSYRTKMPDGKHLLSKTREGLLDKLLDYYGIIVGSSSIKDVFKQADEYYITAHNYDPVETGKRHKQDFNRYFSKIKDSDICEWNKDKFNAYIKETVSELQIIESALGKFQVITNIIFGYAFEFGFIKDNWHKTIDWSSFLQYTIYKAKSTDDEAFSDEQIELIWNEIEKRKNHPEEYYHYYHGYYACGYAIQFSSLVGARIGEIPALLWRDVDWDNDCLRIHRQQKRAVDGISEEVSYTKNEKRHPKNGRLFILYPKLRDLLLELKDKQAELGIRSDYIFCDIEGNPLRKKTIYDALRRLCKNTLGLNITKNHAFRKALNSSDAMQSLTSAQRGALFGHSARVNEEHYTIVKDDKLINSAKKAFGMENLAVNDDGNSTNDNGSIVKNCDNSSNNGLRTPNEPHKIIQFPKRKTLKVSRLQGL